MDEATKRAWDGIVQAYAPQPQGGAQAVVQGLVERGLPEHIAYGVAGNMQVESDGFKTDVNEYAPLVPGSRGGYGLNQWTGPRRRQFEQYASSRGAAPSDLNTQLDFTMWELQNTERNAFNALQSAQTPAEAAAIYSQKFLRPGIPHLDRRIEAANALAGGQYPQGSPQGAQMGQGQQRRPIHGVQQPVQGQPPQPPQQPPAPAFQNMLDPRDFQTPQAAYQIQRFT